MSCPKCNASWRKLEGNQLICECGYIEDVHRVKTPEEQLIECIEENKRLKKLLATTPPSNSFPNVRA